MRPFSAALSFRHRTPRLALLLATTALTGPGLVSVAAAQNLPTGSSVAAGSASVAQPSSTSLAITQSSQSAVVNWQSFSIGQGYSVNITQPNASSALLNRVTGSTPSSIAGSLTANGQVYLVNPNGIAITPTGTVNVGGGFVASTLGISDADFMSGKRGFTGNGASAGVSNAGTITVGRGGYAALIGGTVTNSGNIYVPLGKVGLGSGEQATLDFSGDGFLQVALPTSAKPANDKSDGALIQNSGTIKADGGAVIMSAATAREAARNAINISGVVQARSIGGKTGAIEIGGGEGGQVTVSGKLTTASRKAKGGNITVTGKDIVLAGAKLNASGKTGGGSVKVGGDRQGGGTLQRADTVTMDAASRITADATGNGNGGNVVVWSDVQTNFAGTISAKGGADGGNGGEAEVSSHGLLNYGGLTDLSAPKGSLGNLLLDPYNVMISSATDAAQGTSSAGGTTTFTPTGTSVINVTTLQNALNTANVTVTTGGFGSAGSDAGDITVASAVTWSSANSLTLSAYRNINVNAAVTSTGGANVNLRADNSGMGSGTVSFGAGIQVSTAGTVSVYYNPSSNPATGTPSVNSTSYKTATDYSGNITGGGSLTGYMLVNNVYDLQNVNNNLGGAYALGRDIDASVTSTWNSGAGFLPIGNLTLNTSNYNISGSYFGGIFDGQNQAISNLTINRYSTNIVGLFSGNTGQIRNLGVTSGTITGSIYVGGLVAINYGNVINSFSGAAVSGYRTSGGLAGFNGGGSIRSSYATGSVTNTLRGQGSGGDGAGGLVGYNGATIVGSYSTGSVYANGGAAGGLVANNNGSISQSYETGNVFGYVAGGLVGANSGSINQTYATGSVGATYNPQSGGLVGYDVTTGASVANSYWDTQTTGRSNGIGGQAGTFQATGLTTAQFMSAANMPGLTFGTTPGASGFVIVDSDGSFNNAGNANGATRPFLLSEYSTSIANTHQLQLMGLAPSASYTLMRNIDLSTDLASTSGNWFTSNVLGDGYGFVSIGNSLSSFLGTFDGGGHTISNLSISRGDTTGLFGYVGTGATIQNVGVVNGTVAGGTNVGMVAGENHGTITNVYSTGTVSGFKYVGGLVGFDGNGISRSYSSAAVTAPYYAGGLVGQENGTISQSYAGGPVSGQQFVGGLVGFNASGTISDAYASGAVTGLTNSSNVGGLVGFNDQGTITRTYATGAVTGTSVVGGLIGYNTGSVTNSFWDTTTTGLSQGYGRNFYTFNATGLTTAQLQDLSSFSSTYAGWDFQNVWAPPNQVGQNNGSSTAHYPELYAFLTVLTIAPNAVTRNYGDANPVLTATYYGNLKPGDSFATLASLFTSAGQFSNVGDYAITASGAAVTNVSGNAYRLVYIPGVLTVAPRPITVTADGKTRVYGDTTDPTLTYQITSGNLVNGDMLTGSLSTLASSTTGVGNYAINLGTLGNSNYAITYGTANETITARQITVTANAQSRYYGDADPTFTYAVGGSGLVNGDSLSGSLATSATLTSNVGNYGITQGNLGNSNYQITGYTQANLAVNARPITVTANAQSKVYGSADPTLGYTVGGNGLANGDTLSGTLGRTAGENVIAGGYAINQGGVTSTANPNYAITYNGNTLTITPATLTIAPNSGQSKTYGNADPTFGYAATGQVVNSTLGINDSSLALTGVLGRVAGETVAGGPYAYTLNSLSAGANYTLVIATNPASFAITPATLTIAPTSGQSKTYGNTDPTLTYAATGQVVNASLGLDDSGLALTGALGRTAGETVAGGPYGYTLNTLSAGSNYTLVMASNPSSFAITPAALTIAPNSGQSKTYGNADPTFTYAITGQVVNGSLGINDSGLILTGALGRAAGETVLGGPYGYTLNTLSAGGNYTLAMAASPSSFAITPRAVTVTADAQSKVYGSADPTLTYTVGGNGLVNGDTLSGTLSRAAGENVIAGGYAITQGGVTNTANPNYAIAYNGNTLTVTPATLTIAPTSGQSKTYGNADPSFTYGATGQVVNPTLGIDDSGLALTGVLGRAAGETVAGGPYGYTLNTLSAGANYTLVMATNPASFAITPATLTYAANTATRQYGDANPALSGAVTGYVNGESAATALTGTLTFTTGATGTSGVGNYDINGSGLTANNGNYVFVQAAGNASALSITPRTITVTAAAQSKIYGSADPTLTYTVGGNGLANGDTLSGALGRTVGENVIVGGYAIAQGGVTNTANPNYAISYTSNTLTITPATLTIAPTSGQSKTYGSADPTFTYGATGQVVNASLGINDSGLALTGALGRAAGETVAGGPYGYTLNSLSAGANYTLTMVTSPSTFAINPATLTYIANSGTRQYGDVNPSLSGTVTGYVNGESAATALTGTLMFSTGAGSTSGIGNYGITGSGLTANNGNYTFVQAAGNATALSITPRNITVTADAQSRTYGDGNPALTYAVGSGGLVNGDTLSGGLITSAAATSNVGNYAIAQGSLAASANYALTYTGATLSVTPRAITVTADAQSRTYGDANPSLTYALGGNGLVNGDTLSGALFTAATAGSNVGSYGIAQGSLAASSNYSLTYTGAALSITPRSITVAANAQNREYGDANPALTYAVGGSGLVNGDTLSGGLSMGATATSNVGGYAITQGTLAASANYTLASFTGSTLTVTPRQITVTADAKTKFGGDVNPALTYAVTRTNPLAGPALVNGDILPGVLATSADTSSPAGSYAITQGTVMAPSANYLLTYVGANLTVQPRATSNAYSAIVDRVLAGTITPIALPVGATAIAGAPQIETADGLATFYADPRSDRALVCFGTMCFVAF